MRKSWHHMNDLIYWVWLSLKNGAGHSDANKMLKRFVGGAKEIYEAPYERIAAVADCSPSFIRRLQDHDLSEAVQILEFCFANGIRVISCVSPNYPRRLNNLRNKPLILYVRGNIEDLNERFCVSIVGTRNMSGYGKHITFALARQLIAYGAIIISGAAYGIDSTANNTAIFMEEPTVAVLGSGVNVPYPQKNKDMLDYIATTGMVVSEFPPNTAPLGKNFPIRNRIISGLADAVVVVEAGEKSGALITARCAEEQGRLVYAVPGNLGVPNSVGTNNMIRDGAKMVTRAEDIIEDFAERFNLSKIDRIVTSDKYLRYEYNHRIPTRPENKPISLSSHNKSAGLVVQHTKSKVNVMVPDIPTPDDFTLNPTNTKEAPGERVPEVLVKRTVYTRPAAEAAMVKKTSLIKQKKRFSNDVNVGAVNDTEYVVKNNSVNDTDKERIPQALGETERRVLEAIPYGTAVTSDKIAQAGIPTDKVLSSLTLLELYSAVEALPGGLYKRKI